MRKLKRYEWGRSTGLYWLNTSKNTQMTFEKYDWRNAILNWTVHGKNPIYHWHIEILRFKITWTLYSSGI